jgi:hypothetical protein
MLTGKKVGILAGYVSSNAVRLFFLSILVFANAMCFATEQEEIQRLREIVGKIVSHVSPERSASRFIHDQIIAKAKERKKNYTDDDLDAIQPNLLSKLDKMGINYKHVFKNIIVDYVDTFKKNPNSVRIMAEVFAKPLAKTWNAPANKPSDDRLVNCVYYAYYTFSAVIFDNMNRLVENEGEYTPLFTSVAIINTLEDSGDHTAVIVEGASGTVYFVDSWSEKVAIIPGFTARSAWKTAPALALLPSVDRALPLNQDLSNIINRLSSDNGYYDMEFVKPDTRWVLYTPFSHHLSQLIQHRNNSIRPLYNSLMPIFNKNSEMSFSFGWKPYDELFAGHEVSTPDKATNSETKEEK